jgi:hypothetical protein
MLLRKPPTATTALFIAPSAKRPRIHRTMLPAALNPHIENEAGMSFSFSRIKLAVHGTIPVLGGGNSKIETGKPGLEKGRLTLTCGVED